MASATCTHEVRAERNSVPTVDELAVQFGLFGLEGKTEIRALGNGAAISRKARSARDAATIAIGLTAKVGIRGIYFSTGEPVAAWQNSKALGGEALLNSMVARRRTIVIDFDRKRKVGPASTDDLAEIERQVVRAIQWLVSHGVPATSFLALCTSNGFQIHIRTAVASSTSIDKAVAVLLQSFNWRREFPDEPTLHHPGTIDPDANCESDTSVSNAARICRVPLLPNRKFAIGADENGEILYGNAGPLLAYDEALEMLFPATEPAQPCDWQILQTLIDELKAAKQEVLDRRRANQKNSVVGGTVRERFVNWVLAGRPDEGEEPNDMPPERNAAYFLIDELGFSNPVDCSRGIKLDRPPMCGSGPPAVSGSVTVYNANEIPENAGKTGAFSGTFLEAAGKVRSGLVFDVYETAMIVEHAQSDDCDESLIGDAAALSRLHETVQDKYVPEWLHTEVRAERAREAFGEFVEPDDDLEPDESQSALKQNRLLAGALTEEQLRTVEIKPVEPIIEGLVSDGQPLLIAGPAKSYKSTLMWDLIVSVTSGSMVFQTERNGERIGFNVRKKKKVLVFQVEGSLASHAEAIDDIKHQKGIPDETLSLILKASASPDIGTEKGRQEVFDAVRRTGAEIVVLDNLTSMMPSIDANSKEERHFALVALQNGLEKLGATYWAVAHFRKMKQGRYSPDKPPTLEDISGGGLAEAASNVILVDPPFAPVGNTAHLRLQCSSRELGIVDMTLGIELTRSAAPGCENPYEDTPQTINLTDRGTRGYDLHVATWDKYHDVKATRAFRGVAEKEREQHVATAKRNAVQQREQLIRRIADAVDGDPPRVGLAVSHVKRILNADKGDEYASRAVARIKELIDSGIVRLLRDRGTVFLTWPEVSGEAATMAELVSRLTGKTESDFAEVRTFEVCNDELAQLYREKAGEEKQRAVSEEESDWI